MAVRDLVRIDDEEHIRVAASQALDLAGYQVQVFERAEKALAEQYPLGRWGDVLDTARTVRWLLSEEAAWINGQVLPVDSGRDISPATAPSMAGISA